MHRRSSVLLAAPVFLAAGVLGVVLAGAQPPASTAPVTSQPTTSLAALTWLAGRWEGRLKAGKAEELWFAEEHWSEPRGGLMMGMFRLSDATGRTIVLELETFRELAPAEAPPGGAIELRFRHFNHELEPLEEKGATPTMRLTAAGPERFVFEAPSADELRPNTPLRLVITRMGPDEFRAQVDSVRDGQEVQILDFVMRRGAGSSPTTRPGAGAPR